MGSNGFIGKHLCGKLERQGFNVFHFDPSESSIQELDFFIDSCDFIVHLAGVNRYLNDEEFNNDDINITKKIVNLLKTKKKKTPIIMASSSRAGDGTDYGETKLKLEEYLFSSSLPVYIYRLTNVFGKHCKPYYFSIAATLCYDIANGITKKTLNYEKTDNFIYVVDICNEFIDIIKSQDHSGFKTLLSASISYNMKTADLYNLLVYFKQEIESERHLPVIKNEFELKLFKTFCDYLSEEGNEYNFAEDSRGYFEELYKSKKWGQISENVSLPGIIKGGHYHTYKREIFYTVIGKCEIKERNINTNEMIECIVDGNNPQFVNMIPYYTHQIKNIGNDISHTIMWISEIYNPLTSDTYREEVEK